MQGSYTSEPMEEGVWNSTAKFGPDPAVELKISEDHQCAPKRLNRRGPPRIEFRRVANRVDIISRFLILSESEQSVVSGVHACRHFASLHREFLARVEF